MYFESIFGPQDDSIHHDNTWAQYPGEAIGTAVGAYFGSPQLGAMAGKNAGFTFGDAIGGNMKGLGMDVSANLPPGFQHPGWGGIANAATGLPLTLFGLKF